MKAKKFLSFINNFIPKFNIVIFNSNPDFSDNSFALYTYLITYRKDVTRKYKIIWACNNKESLKRYKRIAIGKVTLKKSFMGIFYFLISKKIICTHNYFYDIKSSKNQNIYNLWHGCGYKKLSNDRNYFRGDYTFVTSPIYIDIQSRELNIPKSNVIPTGLARNDKLFKLSNCLEKFNVDRELYDKIIIWLPTYRKSKIKGLRNDGSWDGFGISQILEEKQGKIENILEEKNILLIVKPHPLEVLDDLLIQHNPNIMFITNDMMREKEADLYDLLQETDGLISDYSSVIIDYLLLDKPIAIVCSDYESYKNDRGFVFNNIEDYLPGPMIKNKQEFAEYIEHFSAINEKWDTKRMNLKEKMHSFADENSCERIADFIFGK